MAVSKITFPSDVTDFPENSAIFACGSLYIADGDYTKSTADTAFADLDAKESELSSKFIKLSDLAEKPFKLESKVAEVKTLNYILEGKRTSSVELNLVGLTQARKDWLEVELGKKNRTIILENKTEDSVMIFNNKRWVCEWVYEAESVFNATIRTEFAGPTSSGFMVYNDIPAGSGG
ncbi:MAG: hypothetical protein RBS16_01915 [Candidatus Cloacimonadales bacterium]|jgi:hypothetical protein|nr:hypothetical protein [Candidatus Cloacimonadota bacterium]MDX9976769.1 hypothetical protein [Candidatus Cloacimonadales bacterium]